LPRWILAALLLPAGCVTAAGPDEDDRRLAALQDDAPAVRDDAFQLLLREGVTPAVKLRSAVGLGRRSGFPVAALLYAQGRGDAVPLDLRAQHLAGFEWPRASA